jgi:hypothetical protein
MQHLWKLIERQGPAGVEPRDADAAARAYSLGGEDDNALLLLSA